MPIVQHKFLNHRLSEDTEILILGTFNPDIPTGPDFFYGRPKNYLWQLLPGCWGIASLKFSQLSSKEAFMYGKAIDFIDLIESVDVPVGEETNVDDEYIDDKVSAWRDIVSALVSLPKLKAVYFTRKTFAYIPNIKAQILLIQNHCAQHNIRFCLLETPARFVNAAKQQQWTDTIIDQTQCVIAR